MKLRRIEQKEMYTPRECARMIAYALQGNLYDVVDCSDCFAVHEPDHELEREGILSLIPENVRNKAERLEDAFDKLD